MHAVSFHKNMSRNMVLGQLMTNAILDPRILEAMSDVPREAFVPAHLSGSAYVDEDLEITPGRCLMAPLAFARLLDLANITFACRVLNIGCLTGYSAVVIARLAASVVATDIDSAAVTQARGRIQQLGVANVRVETVDSLTAGYAPLAPYDAIVIGGAVGFIPDALGAQLVEGGRIAAIRRVSGHPGSLSGLGKMVLAEKIDGRLQYREHFDAASASLPGFEGGSVFVF